MIVCECKPFGDMPHADNHIGMDVPVCSCVCVCVVVVGGGGGGGDCHDTGVLLHLVYDRSKLYCWFIR